jgi:mannose-1-phosphate guanylyltransferase
MKIKPVILAGGQGTRLWPFSEEKCAKQFLKVFPNKSLFQQTIERHSREYFDTPIVIASENQRFIVAEQLREIGVEAEIIIEPISKNTAACVMLAALKEINYDGLIAIIPADHIIEDFDLYLKNMFDAKGPAHDGYIVTLGIKPLNIHTGYGYIKQGLALGYNIYKVQKFIEKPNYELATEYFNHGTYLWNSGIFIFKPNILIEEAKLYENTMLQHVENSLLEASFDQDFIRLNNKYYSKISPNSIDYSIMEKSHKIAVVKADFGWRDLGNWSSLWQIADKDENNNAVFGNTLLEEVSDSYIRTGGANLPLFLV